MSLEIQKINIIAEIEKKKDLVKSLYCRGSTDDEFQLFIHACKRTGLDPFMKQIYAIKRGSSLTIQTGIDGLRLIAERTGNYCPGKEPSYIYDDKGVLIAATAYIKKMTSDTTWHEIGATAYREEYDAQQGLWKKMPRTMLAKCAEAIALRKAFPAELSGVYAEDEMQQADTSQRKVESKLSEIREIGEITDEQWAELDYLSMELGDKEYELSVASHIGIPSLHDIQPKDYKRVIKALENRIKKKVEASNGSATVA